jgi:hypothetical protein
MVMRRHLARIARAGFRLEEIHHEGRAAEDPPEPARRRRDVETVGSDLRTPDSFRPRLERRQIGVRRRIRRSVGAQNCEIFRSRRHHAHHLGRAEQRDGACPRRHETDGVTANDLALVAPHDLRARPRIGKQHDIFVGLVGPAQHGALVGVAIGDDEVLAAGVPGACAVLIFGRCRFVEFRILGACEVGGGGFCADRSGGERGAGISAVIHASHPWFARGS